MNRLIKKNIITGIFIVVLIDLAIGFFLFNSRSFSHLAIWNIIESNKKEDFYWQPEDAPKYFSFEPSNNRLSIFRNEISPLVKNENDEFKIILEVARYTMDIGSDKIQPRLSLKWGSPEEILRQIREGAGANCLHRSILFSTYLSSLGIKSRLWALENDNFDAIAHSACEVYIKSLEKWVFIDVMLGFYATDNKKPLSFLELRERLLDSGAEEVLLYNIHNEIKEEKETSGFYSRLIKCVFLRADNDFVNKYDYRYGVFPIFQRYLDKLPDDMGRGLDYLLGRRDIFIHYVDRFNRTLKSKIITAKLLFSFFIFSLVSMGILFCLFLKRFLAASLSKEGTRHNSSSKI